MLCVAGSHCNIEIGILLIDRSVVDPSDLPVAFFFYGADDGHRQLAIFDSVESRAHAQQQQRNQQSSAHTSTHSISTVKWRRFLAGATGKTASPCRFPCD